MKIDLQIHSVYSSQALYKKNYKYFQLLLDSTMEIRKIIDTAKKVGLDAISITDHGEDRAYKFGKEYAKKVGIKIIKGAEFKTNLGEILIYGNIKDLPLNTNNFYELAKSAKKKNCLLIAPHPYLQNPFGYNGIGVNKNVTATKAMKYVDAVCVYYFKTGIDSKSLSFAKNIISRLSRLQMLIITIKLAMHIQLLKNVKAQRIYLAK